MSDNNPPRVVNIAAVNVVERQRAKMSEAIREMQGQLPIIIAGQQAMAQVTRARYLALIEEGFTPAQALELCK